MAADILDPSALISALPTSLSPNTTLRSPQDALAVLVHTIMLSLSFRLIGIDDSSLPKEFSDGKLSEGWSTQGPGHYAFRYRHEQSSLEFLVKLTKLADRTLINAIALGSDRTATLDIKTSDYTSESFFPVVPNSGSPLVHGFISSARVSDFVSIFKLKILSNIMPGLHKPGYQESTESGVESTPSQGSRASNRPQQQPRNDPYPRRPDIDPDPLRVPRPESHIPPDNPLSIGRRDLDPVPMGSNPFAPPPLFPPNAGDGMFVGPDHPIFGGRIPSRGSGDGLRGPWGGDGFLPPMGAPPGARFDPIFPEGGGLPGGGRRGGLRQGDPDNDEFMPPGSRDMYM